MAQRGGNANAAGGGGNNAAGGGGGGGGGQGGMNEHVEFTVKVRQGRNINMQNDCFFGTGKNGCWSWCGLVC